MLTVLLIQGLPSDHVGSVIASLVDLFLESLVSLLLLQQQFGSLQLQVSAGELKLLSVELHLNNITEAELFPSLIGHLAAQIEHLH